ncbi:hypothetical protein CPLU01_05483 [Colletotrichum plurivorum]|uniref:Uncharacterized protein n=1 Tax=Colletotrichum plurivorum TaxID=2175906 RepID=A0A8H6KLT8_9PEZI|nr:hypothetical protein CPLU01_05483 [Colletotrichum plurivorum]
MAVRPTGPRKSGVHFFSVQRDINNHFTTTLPSFSETSRLPWNPSAYFFDFGMWTACKESRAVVTSNIRKRFETRDLKYSALAEVRHNQKDITFGLFPIYDLICIQPPETESLASRYYNVLSGFNIRGSSSPYYAYIGFEYDVSWTFDPDNDNIHDMTDEPGSRGAFFTLLAKMISGELRAHLHLIQYGAKLKPNKRVWETFYGNGFNFAVAEYDNVEMEDTCDGMNAWDFIRMVTYKGETCWAGWKDDRCGGHLSPGFHIKIGADSQIRI